MNLLLDTQIALWWLSDAPELPDTVREVVQDSENVVFVSAASMWEIAIKRAIGKLEIGDDYDSEIAAQGLWNYRSAGSTPSGSRHSRCCIVIPSTGS